MKFLGLHGDEREKKEKRGKKTKTQTSNRYLSCIETERENFYLLFAFTRDSTYSSLGKTFFFLEKEEVCQKT